MPRHNNKTNPRRKWLTTFPIGKMPNIVKQIFPSWSPLIRILKCRWEEFVSSWNDSSLSSMKPLSPDTNPGIRGTFGAGGKKRGVLSSYFSMRSQSFWKAIYGAKHLKKQKKRKSHTKKNKIISILQKLIWLKDALEYSLCSSSR